MCSLFVGLDSDVDGAFSCLLLMAHVTTLLYFGVSLVLVGGAGRGRRSLGSIVKKWNCSELTVDVSTCFAGTADASSSAAAAADSTSDLTVLSLRFEGLDVMACSIIRFYLQCATEMARCFSFNFSGYLSQQF